MTRLHQVAEHLSQKARSLSGDDADAFGRSAFNRYYYAAYLSVRELLSTLDSAWGKKPHSAIPDFLEDKVLDLVKTQAKRMATNGLLSETRRYNLSKQAAQALSDIAATLRVAYRVRVVADYRPYHLVVFDHAEFRLAEHSQAEARNWMGRVDRAKGALIGISKELGLV